jgi:SnoaL-like domain
MSKILGESRLPLTFFALLTNAYVVRHGISAEDVATQKARRRRVRSLEEVLAGKPVSGSLASLQNCPMGEGAAAIVAFESVAKEHELDASRATFLANSVGRSASVSSVWGPNEALNRETIHVATTDAESLQIIATCLKRTMQSQLRHWWIAKQQACAAKAAWNFGKYEMEYVKQKGVWKILRFRWRQMFLSPYDKGRVKENIDPGVGSSTSLTPVHESDSSFFNPYRSDRTNPFDPPPPAAYKD